MDIPAIFKISQKQEIRGRKTSSKGAYSSVSDGEVNFSNDEIRSFSEISILSPFPFSTLLDWHELHGRHDLPWRRYDLDTSIRIYRVWLSEILLQQTQVSRVRRFYDRIIERYPTIEDLARASYEDFFSYYQGLGYYSRARNLLKTAQIIANLYGGEFPQDKKELLKLPGIGSYTTGAILAFGYGLPHLAWDTNLEKIFARYYHGSRADRLSREEKAGVERQFQGFLEGITNHELRITNTRSINNALMDYAALVESVSTESRDWVGYIFTDSRYYQTRGSLEGVEKKVSRSFPTPDAQIIVILHRDHRVYFSRGEILQEQNPWWSEITSRLIGELSTSFVPPCEGDQRKYKAVVRLVGLDGFVSGNPPVKGGMEVWMDDSDDSDDSDIYLRNPLSYSPFLIPPAMSRDIREYLKTYFLDTYSLHLSVRPPREKGFTSDGRPYIVVFAQVQVGEIPREWKEWRKKFAKKEKMC